MFTSIYQMKKGKFNSDKGNCISDINQNNKQKEKISIYENSNKKINLTANKTQPIRKQYINYESLNNSSKKKDSKIYNVTSNNNEQYVLSYNNYLQNNIYENTNENETFKSKINSYNYITPKNYIFGTDSKNKNKQYETYFNKNIPIKIGEKNNGELSKSTSNFNIPYSFSSANIIDKNLNNNNIRRELTSYNNSIYNNYNYYTIRKNNLINTFKEFKSQTQIEGGKKEINININHKKSSTMISKPKAKNINKNISNNNNNNSNSNSNSSINKIRNKSTKEKTNHYNISNINNFDNIYNNDNNNDGMNNKNNKILEIKKYYDNSLINNDDLRKTQFNPNINYYRNGMNKDYLYNTIKKKKNISMDQLKKEKINNIKVYKNLNCEKDINKNKESQNYHTNRINFNNYNIGKNNNNYQLDNNVSNEYNSYNGTFVSKPIKVNINKNNNSEIYETNNFNQRNSVNNNKNIIQKYENKRNKSERKK